MNVLFLSLLDFNAYSEKNIYTDLLREFIKHGHDVYCISPVERRTGVKTHLKENGRLLKLRIGNTQKTNIIEKGISTLLIEPQFKHAISKYFSDVKFDLILYSTPPITFANVIKYVKKRDGAKTYLMLKDIFPQNAVDIGMMSKNGLIYKYFRKKEKNLYALSDCIGCMSQANVEYILEHNVEISKEKVGLCPNCIEAQDLSLSLQEKSEVRKKYGIPLGKKVFVYGGNLGRPQDVPFILKCLQVCTELNDFFFVIAGSGTDRHLLEQYISEEKPNHVRLFEQLPKNEYDRMIACCDVGLIFLDHRFTIPNFPSRTLSYMQAGLPILACTDSSTDIGNVIISGDFGWWCESDDVNKFEECIKKIDFENIEKKSKNSKTYLLENYCCDKIYKTLEISI